MTNSYKGLLLLLIPTTIVAITAVLLSPFPQPLAYHDFADHRAWLGIPNFGDVTSNIPFSLVGIWGLVALFTLQRARFHDPRMRWLYSAMFTALILTAVGSAYYHLAPDNARLVWDRTPIIMVFMALLAAVIAERTSTTAGLILFPLLEVVGVSSVLAWRASELRNHGDLRFYAAVQLGAVLVLLTALFLRPAYTRGYDFGISVAFYALAKIFEELDRPIYAVGHIVSGHTLKHLAAAASGYWILRMLQKRVPLLEQVVT